MRSLERPILVFLHLRLIPPVQAFSDVRGIEAGSIRERLGVKLPRATRLVVGFQHADDARRFQADVCARLGKFGLTVHPGKTRLLEFGRFAAGNRRKRGLGKPETFNFLGFTHICERSRNGSFLLMRKTRRDRMRTRLRAIKTELRRRMHMPIGEQGRWLAQVVRGYFAYHAVPTNTRSLSAFRFHVTELWRRTLRRRSQRGRSTWNRMTELEVAFLPLPRILQGK